MIKKMNLLKCAVCIIGISINLNCSAQKYFYGSFGYSFVSSVVNSMDYGGNYQTPFPTIQGSIGYSLSRRFSVELDANKFSTIFQGGNSIWDSVSIQMIRVMPMLKYQFLLKTISLYAKGGLSIGIANKERLDVAWANDVPPFNYGYYQSESSGGIALGYVWALGGEFKVYRNLSLYGELQVIYNYWARKNITILYAVGENNIDYTPLSIITAGVNFGLKYNFW
jgi:hypothetical protein